MPVRVVVLVTVPMVVVVRMMMIDAGAAHVVVMALLHGSRH